MKRKSASLLSGNPGMFFVICMAVLVILPGGIRKGSAQEMKRHFKESIVKSSQKKLFNVEVMVKGNELRPGTNKAELVVYDSSGNDVEGAVVTVEPLIQGQEDMAGGKATISDEGAGFYSADNIMVESGGKWALKITVSKDGVEDSAVIGFPEVKEVEEETAAEPAETAGGEKAAEEGAAGPVIEGAAAENPAVESSAEPAVETVGKEVAEAEGKMGSAPEATGAEEMTPEETAGASTEIMEEEKPASEPAETYGKYRTIFTMLPAIAPIPADNPLTESKIGLGRMLFWDRRVSKTGARSCASCHSPSYYGAEPLRKSLGIKGEPGLRNAPTVLNVAFLTTLYWTGESPDLEHLAMSEIESEATMKSIPEEVAERLNGIPEYKALATEVFGSPLTGEEIGISLAAFMRTLITPNYPLARWIQGDENALTESQKRGMALFVDKGCIGCHYGPAFSGPAHDRAAGVYASEHPKAGELGIHLHKVLLPGAEDDTGRAENTGKDEDKYYFRVPLLLNVTKTPPYTHTGMVDSLNEVVKFMAVNMLNTEMSQPESDDIAAFLDSLTGEVPDNFMTAPALPVGGGGYLAVVSAREK